MQSQKMEALNSGDSPVVTHLTTSPPVRCIDRAKRTGSLVIIWSITTKAIEFSIYVNLLTESDLPCYIITTVPAPLSSAIDAGSDSAARRRLSH
jgi:hypothetical protein